MVKNICVVTGTRAEYGIMRSLLKKLDKNETINLQIVVTAMHLEEKYGFTYKYIEEDGFRITKKIGMNLSDTKTKTLVDGMAKLMVEFSAYLEQNNLDLIIILGDRYEMLSIANCAILYNIPICHLHGGELTLGNYDEFIRHAITKMSHLHIVSTEEHKKRVIQMGENEENICNSGAMGVEHALTNAREDIVDASLAELHLQDKYFVVLFHPETLSGSSNVQSQIEELLKALKKSHQQCVFIGANSDSGSDYIMKAINNYVKDDFYHSCMVSSLRTEAYHQLVSKSMGLIGNSSSGLIEAPSLGVTTINIGNRQKGRTRGESVIDVPCEENSIYEAMMRVVLGEVMNNKMENPYYKKDSVDIAYSSIIDFIDNNRGREKYFIDLDF